MSNDSEDNDTDTESKEGEEEEKESYSQAANQLREKCKSQPVVRAVFKLEKKSTDETENKSNNGEVVPTPPKVKKTPSKEWIELYNLIK